MATQKYTKINEIDLELYNFESYNDLIEFTIKLLSSNKIDEIEIAVYLLLKELSILLISNSSNPYFPFPFYSMRLTIKLFYVLNKLKNFTIENNILIIFINLLQKYPNFVNFSLFSTHEMSQYLFKILNGFIELFPFENFLEQNTIKSNELFDLTELVLILFGNLFMSDKSFIITYESVGLIDIVVAISKVCEKYKKNISLNKVKCALLYNLSCLALNTEHLNYESYSNVCKHLCSYRLHEFEGKLMMMNALKKMSCTDNMYILNIIFKSTIIQDFALKICDNYEDSEENIKIIPLFTFIISKLSLFDDEDNIKMMIHSKCLDFLIICLKNKKIRANFGQNICEILCQCLVAIYNIVLSYNEIIQVLIDSGILNICLELLSNENVCVRENVCHLLNICIIFKNDNLGYFYNFLPKICKYLHSTKYDDVKNHAILIQFCFKFIEKAIVMIRDKKNIKLFLKEIFNFDFEKTFNNIHSSFDKIYNYDEIHQFNSLKNQLYEWRVLAN